MNGPAATRATRPDDSQATTTHAAAPPPTPAASTGRASQATWWWHIALLVVAAIPVLFFRLGSYGLVNGDEGFYHEVARTMVERGDWARLEFAGQHRVYDTFTHAPLFLWLKAATMAAFGDNYWTMRVVSTVSALATVLIVYAFGRQLMRPGFALLAGLIQLTTFQFVYLHCGRTGEMEPLIAGLVLLAPMLLARALERGTSLVPHHVCLVALLNLKAAFILIPVVAEALFFAVTPPHRARFRDWLRDAMWVLPLGASWHLYQIATGWTLFAETIDTLLYQVQRGTTLAPRQAGLLARMLANSSFYLQTLLWGGFPYSLLVPAALPTLLGRHAASGERHRWWLLGCYASVCWAYFSVVALRFPWYITPIYGILALAVASWLSRWAAGTIGHASLTFGVGLLALLPWARVQWLSFNPFASAAMSIKPRVRWATGWAALPGWLWPLLVFTIVAAGGWLLLRLRESDRKRTGVATADGHPWQRTLALGCAAALVAIATVRVGSSLVHTDRVSKIERFARDLETRRASGEALSFPVVVPAAQWFVVGYLFHRDYELKQMPRGALDRNKRRFVLLNLRQQPGEP